MALDFLIFQTDVYSSNLTVWKFNDFSATVILREINCLANSLFHKTQNLPQLISRKKSQWEKNEKISTLCT